MKPIVVASWCFWSFRLAWAFHIALYGDLVGVLWFVAECVQGYVAYINLRTAKSFDDSWHSWGVLCGYSLSYLFVPVPSSGGFPLAAAFGLLGCMLLRVYLCLYMGGAYSSGSINYSGLITCGPWRVVRHPLASVGVASRVAFCLAFPSVWNCAVVAWSAFLAWYCAVGEEKYLSKCDQSYLKYAERVPDRFLPVRGARLYAFEARKP